MKIDWKKKLTSRKFWVAIVGFVTPLVIAFGGTEDQSVQIAGLIMAGASVIAYIIGEGLVDGTSDANYYVGSGIDLYKDDVEPQTDEEDFNEDIEDLDVSGVVDDDTPAEG